MAQYTPKPDNHDINVDRREPVKTILSVFAITLAAAVAFVFIFFFILQLLLQRITIEQEQRWFSWFDGAVEGKPIDHPQMIEIFRKAGIAENIHVKVICDSNMNAFAWPGGNIVLTSQLFKNLETEEGMAFVLGHEMGHIKNRDHLKGMARTMTVVVVDMVTGMSQWPGANALISLLTTAYGRDQEISADKTALTQMREAYGHLKGGDEFFNAIKKEPQEMLHKNLWFLSTHPVTDDRLQLFEEPQKDVTSVVQTTSRRILFDRVLCDSGCEPEACGRLKDSGPKSGILKNKKPISLKDRKDLSAPAQTPTT